jgi:actin-like ATPase involved in cell morphogenesis
LGYCLGVDVGTTYTAAAIIRDGRPEMAVLGSRTAAVPTMVYAEGDVVVVGEAARRRLQSEPGNVAREFKRRLGDTVPIFVGETPRSAESLLAVVLRWTIDKVTEQEGAPPDQTVVTHPANWGPFRRELFGQAISLAGAPSTSTLTEPEAAAIYYASTERVAPGELVAVYDLGGGTFDAALLRKTDTSFDLVGAPEGIEHLGGIDVDDAVFEHVKRSLDGAVEGLDPTDPAAVRALHHLRAECAEAKEALSFDPTTTIPVMLPGTQTQIVLRRADLERMIRPLLEVTVSFLQRVFDSAGIEPSEVRSVLLVGGSSRIPLVAEMVGAEIGRPVAVDAHPKHAIALGAAIAADHRNGAPATAIERRAAILDLAPEAPTAPSPATAAADLELQRAVEPPGAAPGRPSRRRRAAIAAGVGVVLLVAALAAVLRPDDGTDVDTTTDVPLIDGVVDEGDLWVAAVADPGAVVKVDRDTDTVVGSVAIDGIAEEAVVTDDAAWVAAIDPADGAVVYRLDRRDATLDVRLPLDVDDAASIELVRTGQGVWAVCVSADGLATVVGVDADGDLTTRTEVDGAQLYVEPVTDGERLFVPSVDGVVRIDGDGSASAATLPGEALGGTPALTDGRLFVLRNDRLIEVDADTMEVIGTRPYALDGETTALLEHGAAGIQIEEAYGDGNVLTFLASDSGLTDGAYFFRIDADTGEVVARTRLPGQQQAGTFDFRRGAGVFWAYLSTGRAALLRIDDRGQVEEIELPARGELDPDLVANGGRLIVSDVDPEGRPIFHVIDAERGTVEASLRFPS